MNTQSPIIVATHLVATIKAAGFRAFFVGGFVRDKIRDPKAEAKDIDIATNATPDQIKEIFKDETCNLVGEHFGVVIVRGIEIATFRKDGSYSDSRHPESVSYVGSEIRDVERRDFSINGLYYDPIEDCLVDTVNGVDDIKNQIIRCIGDPRARFEEDPLRIMRAIRFATTFGFEIADATYTAMLVNHKLIQNLSIERIRDELNKILLSKNRVKGIDLLYNTGILELILPEFLTLHGCEQSPDHHPEGDVWTHTCLMLDNITQEGVTLEFVLGVLLHDIGKPATQEFREEGRITFYGHETEGADITRVILERMKYPKDTIRDVCTLVHAHMRPMLAKEMNRSTLRKFIGKPWFEDLLELHYLDAMASSHDLSSYEHLRNAQEEFANEPVLPEKLVNGRDLIDLGLQPGAVFSQILNELYNQQLEGAITTKEEGLTLVRNKYIEC